MPNILLINIATWGNPIAWKFVKYNLEIHNFIRKTRDDMIHLIFRSDDFYKSSYAVISQAIKNIDLPENYNIKKTDFLIISSTLLSIILNKKNLIENLVKELKKHQEDAAENIFKQKLIEKLLESLCKNPRIYFGVDSCEENTIPIKDLFIVAPGIGVFDAKSKENGLTTQYRLYAFGDLSVFKFIIYWEIIKKIKQLLNSINIEDVSHLVILFDITHGINYMTVITKDVVDLLYNTMAAIILSVQNCRTKLMVINSDPVTVDKEEANINVIEMKKFTKADRALSELYRLFELAYSQIKDQKKFISLNCGNNKINEYINKLKINKYLNNEIKEYNKFFSELVNKLNRFIFSLRKGLVLYAYYLLLDLTKKEKGQSYMNKTEEMMEILKNRVWEYIINLLELENKENDNVQTVLNMPLIFEISNVIFVTHALMLTIESLRKEIPSPENGWIEYKYLKRLLNKLITDMGAETIVQHELDNLYLKAKATLLLAENLQENDVLNELRKGILYSQIFSIIDTKVEIPEEDRDNVTTDNGKVRLWVYLSEDPEKLEQRLSKILENRNNIASIKNALRTILNKNDENIVINKRHFLAHASLQKEIVLIKIERVNNNIKIHLKYRDNALEHINKLI